MIRSVKDKVVIITGASSGIGRALAFECAARGARVTLAARSLDKLNEVAQELAAAKHEVLIVRADVSLEEDCKAIIRKTVERFGRIDILINNAGISMRASFTDVSLDVIRSLIDVNFWGTVYCTKYAIPYLLESKGSVTGVSSIAGFVGLPGRTGYSASKFALKGFLDTIRTEYLKKDIHVLLACPGFTASNIRNTALGADGTQQGESPRDEGAMMTSEEVARRIVNAIEKRKRTLILTAQGKLTVLLSKLLPSLTDKIVYDHMSKEPGAPFVK